MRIISVLNDKGGVGKTILASLLEDAALILRKRVLVIDLDPQATISRERIGKYGLLPEEEPFIAETHPSLAQYLVQRGDVMNYVIGVGEHLFAPKSIQGPEDFRLAVIWPGYNLNETIERLDSVQLSEAYDSIEGWLENLRELGLWDVCIIDNPPNRAGLSKRLALCSDLVVIPSIPDSFSYEATRRTIISIGSTEILVVPNRCDSRQAIHKEYLAALRELRVPRVVSIAEPILISPVFLSEQARGMPSLLGGSRSTRHVKSTHDMIVRALGLESKSWFYDRIREAYPLYEPDIMAYQKKYRDKLDRIREAAKRARAAAPLPAN